MNLKDHIRAIPDFPQEGFVFYDTSTLLLEPLAWRYAIDRLAGAVADCKPDMLAGIESRGFLLAAPLAFKLGLGLITVRRAGSLLRRPAARGDRKAKAVSTFEVEADAVRPGQRIVVLDDVLATGRTMKVAVEVLRQCGARIVAGACLVELAFDNGRAQLDFPLITLVAFDDDDLIRHITSKPAGA
ncbi:MAG: adenine phosphoribosyltransferase [Kiloniellaceae bacterium]